MFGINPEALAFVAGQVSIVLLGWGVYTVNRRAVKVDTTSWLASAEQGVSRDVKLAEGEAEKIGAAIASHLPKL